jgi:hypothetical protein
VTPDFSPKGIGRLIDEAIAVYRAGFRSLALPAVYLLLPSGLFVGLAQGVYFQTVTRAAPASGGDVGAYIGAIGGAYAILLAMVSLQALVALYYFACVLVAAPELLSRRPVSPGAFLKGGASRILMMFAISIVVGILAGVGVFALFVGSVLVYVYLSMAQPVAGVEGAPLDQALSRSFSLVRHNFWRTVGFFVAVGIIVFSLESALTSFSTIQLVLSGIAGGSSGSPLPSLGWQVFGGLLAGVAQALTLPLMYVAWMMYYLDLRSRREGMDLLARAQALAPAA